MALKIKIYNLSCPFCSTSNVSHYNTDVLEERINMALMFWAF